jgi:hypothetical protein
MAALSEFWKWAQGLLAGLAEAWRIINTPGKDLLAEKHIEFSAWLSAWLGPACKVVITGCILLLMLGARGKVTRIMYWVTVSWILGKVVLASI